MTTATSLILIAVGAVLAFAVSYQVAGMNIQTIGVILIIVGALGLAISMATLAGYAPWGSQQASGGVAPATNVAPSVNVAPAVNVAPPTNAGPPTNA